MTAGDLLTRLCRTIDAKQWDRIDPLLHNDFACHYVHTGETFDKAGWIRVNAEYPGFDRMILEDLVATGDRAVARCHVTSTVDDGRLSHFEVATFATVADGSISSMTEVWTDVAQIPPAGTRPV